MTTLIKYECPKCERAILNRKIDKCLYCGAALPQNLLFSKEQIEKMAEQDRVNKEQTNNRPMSGGYSADNGFDLSDAIDIASDLGGLFD
ncbi:MAG: hypothetical protein ACXU7D_12285 [Burkholderiaceae bacterium]